MDGNPLAWDADQDSRLRSLFDQGLTDAEIGGRLGVSATAIRLRRIRKLGLLRGPRRAERVRRDEVLCMPFSNAEKVDLQSAARIGRTSELSWARGALLNAAELFLNPAFWTQERDEHLRELFVAGRSDAEIAAELDVPLAMASRRRRALKLLRQRRREERGSVAWEAPFCVRLTKDELQVLERGPGAGALREWGRTVLLEEAQAVIEGERALAALRRQAGLVANPGEVIPIGRAVGFEHYGEEALPLSEWQRREALRARGGFRHVGERARPLTEEEKKKVVLLRRNLLK